MRMEGERKRCGCTLRWPVCETGRSLWIDVQCGAAVVESPGLLVRPLRERDAVWDVYNAAVVAYLRHCGELAVCGGSRGSRS
jgi:hypothetical protein